MSQLVSTYKSRIFELRTKLLQDGLKEQKKPSKLSVKKSGLDLDSILKREKSIKWEDIAGLAVAKTL